MVVAQGRETSGQSEALRVLGVPFQMRARLVVFMYSSVSLLIINQWFRRLLLSHLGRITNKAAYAFGLGLERWAMKLYEIPDIRLFWSQDPGFLNQFKVPDFRDPITYKVNATLAV